MHDVTLYNHGKGRSQEHMCSTADACGISNRSVQGDEPGELEVAALGLGQSSAQNLHKVVPEESPRECE